MKNILFLILLVAETACGSVTTITTGGPNCNGVTNGYVLTAQSNQCVFAAAGGSIAPNSCDPGQYADGIQADGTLDCSTPAGGIGGTVGTADNAIPRANGTGGSTLQGSGVLINDSDQIIGPTGAAAPAYTFSGQTSSGLAWNSVFGTVEIVVAGTRYMDAGNNVVAWTKNFLADSGGEDIGRDASNVYGFDEAYVQKLNLGYTPGDSPPSTSAGTVKVKTGTPLTLEAVNDGVDINTSGTKPTCDSTVRGQLFFEEGGTGVSDVLYMCMKAAADTYAWETVKSAP